MVSLGVHQITGKCASFGDVSTGYCWKLLYMLVLVSFPSLHDNYAYMGHSGEVAGRRRVRPLFLLFGVFSIVETSLYLGSGVLSCGFFG